MIVDKFKLMDIGMTHNDWAMTKEMVEASLPTFEKMPIVLVTKGSVTDYNKPILYGSDEEVVGTILDNIVIEDNSVYARVWFWDERYPQVKDVAQYDNWCVQFDDSDKTKFKLISIEIFRKVDIA